MATAKDIDTLARTCYGEARGSGLAGMRVVAWVAKNRAVAALKSPRAQFGDGTLAGACLAPKQFSTWNDDDPNLPIIQAVTLDDSAFQLAMLAAIEAAQDIIGDVTSGYKFYWDRTIPTPYWAQGKPYISIGPFRLVEDA